MRWEVDTWQNRHGNIEVSGELNSVRGIIVRFYHGGVEDCLCCWSCGLLFFDRDGGDYECASHGTPPSPSFEAREYDDGSGCTPSSLSLQPRSFAHIFEENNMARIFGNCHSLLIIIFYPFPWLFLVHFPLKSKVHVAAVTLWSYFWQFAILFPA